MTLTSGKTVKSVQRQYYLLSCRFLLFTRKKRKMKREVLSDSYTEATASAIKEVLRMLRRSIGL